MPSIQLLLLTMCALRVFVLLHCALASCSTVYCNRSCLWVFATGMRAGGVQTLLQPASAQDLLLSERFFIIIIIVAVVLKI